MPPRKLTQTSLDPGNCWQTGVACILDIDPETMPSQVEHDSKPVMSADGTFRWSGPGYNNVLQAYLRKHHGLAYVELHAPWAELSAFLRPVGLHLLTGRTVRSATNGEQRHVVVARDGETVWDPHPSRAGLLDEIKPAFLTPYPAEWAKHGGRRAECVCPACLAAQSTSLSEVP